MSWMRDKLHLDCFLDMVRSVRGTSRKGFHGLGIVKRSVGI